LIQTPSKFLTLSQFIEIGNKILQELRVIKSVDISLVLALILLVCLTNELGWIAVSCWI